MPKGPHGEKRPADWAQCAHTVFQVAVGDKKDPPESPHRMRARSGGLARSASLTAGERKKIAAQAAAARWKLAGDVP